MIKRIIFIVIAILYLLTLSSMAFASGDATNYQDAYRNSVPKSFTAYGVQFPDTFSPYRKLESVLEFNFINNKSIHSSFEFEHSAMYYGYGPSKHKLDLDLTYDKRAFSKDKSIFITGTFTYNKESGGEKYFYTGPVTGRYIYTDESNYSSTNTLCCRNFIKLFLSDDNENWTLELFLEEPEEFVPMQTENNYNEEGYEEGYYNDECAPHVPAPTSQTDVAVGVSASTLGIALINALTKTSPFGSTPFNITFNSNAPIINPKPTPSATGGSGILNAVKNFFKNLLKNLRDMLTDEGRSYASGKVSDVLDDTSSDSTPQ